MEIENAIFQDLESFRKERIFKMVVEKCLIFVWKNSKNILKWIKLSVVVNTVYVVFVHFTIYNTNIIHRKIMKHMLSKIAAF